MPLTAVQYDRPLIPLIDPDSGEKVKLRLRKMSFAREISSLPADMLELHEILIVHRSNQNHDIYMMVAAFSKLSVYEKFWTTFKFSSLEEYLDYYGLPDVESLKSWIVMVELFEKSTFVLLGDKVLNYLVRAIGRYETDTDTRKRDYQAIFDRYCSKYDGFDRLAFYDMIQNYVIEKYEEPAAESMGVNREEWLRQQRTKERMKPGTKQHRVTREVSAKQHYGPTISYDFDWQEQKCPSCLSKIEIIKAFQGYTRLLERVVTKNLGEKYLPTKPEEIKDL